MAHYKFHNDCQSSVLTYEQVKRLDFVMDQTVPIHGRGNFPTLNVKLKELIRLVKYKLQKEHSIEIRDVRLNGGAALYVLAPENSHYNDLDLIFGTDLSNEDQFDVIRDVVLECLKEFNPRSMSNFQHPHQSHQMPLSNCAIKEAYVHKMVKVNDDDRWSLISLGVQQSEANCCGQINCATSTMQRACGIQQQFVANLNNESQSQSAQVTISNENLTAPRANIACNNGPQALAFNKHHNHQHLNQLNQFHHQQHQQQHHQQKQFPNSIELKFVDKMRRKFEFSVDSFQIILDSLIQFYDYAPRSTITSQKKLVNSHLSSTMINTRPLVSSRRCTGCSGDRAIFECKTDAIDSSNSLPEASLRENFTSHNHGHQTNMNGFSEAKMNGSRSYYQLPIESADSPSISSVASSSGCSSSSSVVSSSSSSLSCDEDHEDLYCDDSPSSSSASTSSLISSTTSSLIPSDRACKTAKMVHYHQHQHQQASQSEVIQLVKNSGKQAQQRNQSNKEKSKANQSNRGDCKSDYKASTAVETTNTASDFSEVNPVDCVECFGQQDLASSVYDFETNTRTSCAVISENFYPTVIGRSEYGNFKEALYHLEKKLIATRSPEEIRGGGLLKYCNLLVKNYKPTNVFQIRTLERYMCSRFFIDFSDLNQQQAKLESYLANHFSDDPILKFDYLTILHNVVQRSTVCLMNHELRLTLNMIRDLAYKLNEQQEFQNQQQPQHRHQQQPQQPQQHQQHQQHLQQQQPKLSQMQIQSQHPSSQHHQVQQPSDQQLAQPSQPQQQHYQQQKPVVIQSGVYRVKLVNYTLAKPARP